jgi:hypothetical protein
MNNDVVNFLATASGSMVAIGLGSFFYSQARNVLETVHTLH